VASCFSVGLLLEEVVENRPVVLEILVRNRKAARRADLMDVDDDNAAGARYTVDFLRLNKVLERWCAALKHSTVPKQPHDPGRALKGIQHDGHAVVAGLVDMRDRLVAAAGEFLVPERFTVEDPEVLAAFGRDIDVAIA
jgi:hypothetical protein